MRASILQTLFGGKSAEAVLLFLYHYGEGYGRAIARDFSVSLDSVQRQLDKLEQVGVLVCKRQGRTLVYSWNAKFTLANKIKDVVGHVYNSLSISERAMLFTQRHQPRAKDKPVLPPV